ncbi:AI-2E family transporter [Herbiconiux sp. SYSU D00978]|uniref:AI-2E family transporter n=1 Tax=Herbiconiux sp. SYSU D00978 TaxID=2812562 RepID=UPI001A97A2E7|nr:AI-2E family transporter [Herbiconiux sp. SYSU D00978]
MPEFRKKAPPPPPPSTPVLDAIPYGVQLAGAWSWRLLAIGGVVAVVVFLVMRLELIVVPLFIALLLAALLVPFSQFLQRHRWPKWLAVTTAELGLLAAVAGLLSLVVWQIRLGFPSIQQRTVAAFDELRRALEAPPFSLDQREFDRYLNEFTGFFSTQQSAVVSGALSVGETAWHVFAGTLLVLFATLFFLIDGRNIWSWVVRVFPRRARDAVDGAGRAGWLTLSNFVRVQIFVAFIDAVGIGVAAALLGLPLAFPIAVAVFLGSFIPVVGAVLTGTLAVFVALVYNGPVVALIMLGAVLLVQQLEGHVLLPLITGAVVKVHPLAVVLAVAAGGFLAGIPGALFAVPTVATLNVMISYIASGAWRTVPEPTVEDVTSDE